MKYARKKLTIGIILLIVFGILFGAIVSFTYTVVSAMHSIKTQASEMKGSMESVEQAIEMDYSVNASLAATDLQKARIVAAIYADQKKGTDRKPEYFQDGMIVSVSDGAVSYPEDYHESFQLDAEQFTEEAGVQYCILNPDDDIEMYALGVVYYAQIGGSYYYLEWKDYAETSARTSKIYDINKSFAAFEKAFQESFLLIDGNDDVNGNHILIYRSDALPAYDTAEEYGITAQMLASVQSEKSVQKDLTGEETESQHAEDTKTQDVESLRPETESSQDDMLAMAAMSYNLLTIGDETYELYLRKMNYSSTIGEGKILAYLIPFAAASSSAEEQYTLIIEVLFAIGIVFLVWFYSMMRLVHDHSLNSKQKEEFKPRAVVRMAFSIIGIGAVAILGIAALSMCLFRLYRICNQVDTSLQMLEQRIEDNDVNVRIAQNLQKKNYEDFATLTAGLIQDNPEAARPDNLQTICDIVGADYIMLFDSNGDELVTNSRYIGISLGKDDSSSTHDFRRLLNGVPLITHDLAKDDVTGEDNVMIGVSYTDPSEQGRYRALLMAVPGDKIYDSVAETPGDIMSSLVTEGMYAFSADPETGIIKEASDSSLVGSNAQDLGLPEQALHNGYRDFVTFNGQSSYGECIEINGLLYFYVSGQYHIYEFALPTALIFMIGYLILMSILVLCMLHGYRKFFDEWSEVGQTLKSDVNEIETAEGRRKYSRDPGIRWKSSTERYGSLAPIHNAFMALKVLLVIGIFQIGLVVLTSTDETQNSMLSYILHGQWTKGLNLFALTAILVLFAEVVLAVVLVKLLLRLISQALGTKGDTVCRLLINLADYAGVICFAYFALYDLGFNPSTLLASLGLLSFAISLGAKDLITDVIAGLSIVFEGEYQVGDIIDVGGYRGEVLEIGVRTTKLEGRGGNIKIIGNRDIKNVVNMTRKNSWYPMEINVSSDQSLVGIEKVLDENLPQIGESIPEILSGPYYKGITSMGKGALTLSIIAECDEADYYVVQRALNHAVQEMLEENGIKMV